MQNRDISLEAHQARIAEARLRLDKLLEIEDGDILPETIQEARDRLAALRMEHHPDHWFIDPGSGKDTEDGRLRRRALQACRVDCPMRARLLCLDRGLEEGPSLQYGIYGGYSEKDRQEIVEAQKKRQAERIETR